MSLKAKASSSEVARLSAGVSLKPSASVKTVIVFSAFRTTSDTKRFCHVNCGVRS